MTVLLVLLIPDFGGYCSAMGRTLGAVSPTAIAIGVGAVLAAAGGFLMFGSPLLEGRSWGNEWEHYNRSTERMWSSGMGEEDHTFGSGPAGRFYRSLYMYAKRGIDTLKYSTVMEPEGNFPPSSFAKKDLDFYSENLLGAKKELEANEQNVKQLLAELDEIERLSSRARSMVAKARIAVDSPNYALGSLHQYFKYRHDLFDAYVRYGKLRLKGHTSRDAAIQKILLEVDALELRLTYAWGTCARPEDFYEHPPPL